MKISQVCNFNNKNITNNWNGKNKAKQNNVSFKSIYLENDVDLGHYKANDIPARFHQLDNMLLHEIEQEYPYQDCFIRKGFADFPRLEFREKPITIKNFEFGENGSYKITMPEETNENFELTELLLYKDRESNTHRRPELSTIIGLPSRYSTNPSLTYTIKMGFECHKKVMEKKYQILDIVGRNDEMSLGDDSVITKAHKAMEETEISVLRYLCECALTTLSNKVESKKALRSTFPKIKTTLNEKRKHDLVTCVDLQKKTDRGGTEDLCTKLVETYPNTVENIGRINEIINYLIKQDMTQYESKSRFK